MSGFALFQMPGREADCEAVLRKALHGKQELGDVVGMAYALDVLGWLSVKTGSPARTAWLLGAAEPLWERGGSVRFSGTAIMEEFHQQAEARRAAATRRAGLRGAYAAGDRLTCGSCSTPGRARARCGSRSRSGAGSEPSGLRAETSAWLTQALAGPQRRGAR